jgi:hypothetical protein
MLNLPGESKDSWRKVGALVAGFGRILLCVLVGELFFSGSGHVASVIHPKNWGRQISNPKESRYETSQTRCSWIHRRELALWKSSALPCINGICLEFCFFLVGQ